MMTCVPGVFCYETHPNPMPKIFGINEPMNHHSHEQEAGHYGHMIAGHELRFSGDCYIQFVLSLIIFFYGAWPFIRGLVNEIRKKFSKYGDPYFFSYYRSLFLWSFLACTGNILLGVKSDCHYAITSISYKKRAL